MKKITLLAGLLAPSLAAATLLAVPEGSRTLVRASTNEIAIVDARSTQPIWTAAGVKSPQLLVLSPDGRWAAAIDPISNRLALADLEQRTSRIHSLPETAVAASFFDRALFVVSRDARLLSKIDTLGGDTRTVEVPASASHLIAGASGVIVYAALTGRAARFDSSSLRPLATAQLPRFGSDLETDGESGYLVLPRSGQLAAFSLETLALEDERAAGAVPIDIAVEAPGNATRAVRIAIADPSSKRVWRDEGAQSGAEAFGRGFLRGLLGLGLYRPRAAAFPSGVDRITVSGGRLLAFDTSTRTVWAVTGERATEIASGVDWGSFVSVGSELFVARGAAIQRHPLP